MRKTISGFTIVELLIVIVVIGIIAAITVIAFNGIQAKASLNAARSEASALMKRVEASKVESDRYPASITDCPNPAAGNLCIPPSSSMVFGSHPSRLGYIIGSVVGEQGYMMSSAEVPTHANNEFTQYADLAPFINRLGLRPYKLTFDIKSDNVSVQNTVRVYFQNGSDSRHGGLQVDVPVSTAYSSHTIIFTPTLAAAGVTNSTLAFYGTYGTGNRSTVRNVRLEPN